MICYAIPIYAHKGKSLAHYIGYITNPAKVLPESDYPCYTLQKELSSGMLQTTIVAADGHIKATYVSGYMTTPEELKERVEHLWDVYKSYQGSSRGDEGPIAYHIVISAALNELVSDEEMHLIAAELVEALGAYPGIFATHIRPVWDDRFGGWRGFTKHDHLIVSAFPDVAHGMPQKLHVGFHYERLRAIADRIAIKHGLQIIVDADRSRADSYYAVMQAKKGNGWLEKARQEIFRLAETSQSLDDYEALLTEHGYTLQQIGPDFLYGTADGHTVMGHSLGRQYTRERLEAYWSARREGAIDSELAQAAKEHGMLYARIPLGGRFREAAETCRCCLQTQAECCSEDALRSYYRRGCIYAIEDEDGSVVRYAEGTQVLAWMGVGSLFWDDEKLTESDRERRRRWHLQRIHQESERLCEQQTRSPILRTEYLRLRQEKARREELRACKGRTKKRPTLSEAEFDAPICRKIQRCFDALAVQSEEGVWTTLELEQVAEEARCRYGKAARELARIDMLLEDLRPVKEREDRYQRAKDAFDAHYEAVGSYDALRSQYPSIVAEFEEAMSAMSREYMAHWQSIEQLFLQYHIAEAKRPALLQAVVAEYERVRVLEIALEGKQLLKLDDKPPLDAIIAGADDKRHRKRSVVTPKKNEFTH